MHGSFTIYVMVGVRTGGVEVSCLSNFLSKSIDNFEIFRDFLSKTVVNLFILGRPEGPKLQFSDIKIVKYLKMAYLKNGVRLAVAIYMAEIRPLLGFWV